MGVGKSGMRTLGLGIASVILVGAGRPIPTWSNFTDADLARLIANPPMISPSRLPPDHRIGRCLLVVDGQTRIHGPCAYAVYPGGDFHIAGPRQVYDGIDYPSADSMAVMVSTDYWANIFRDQNGNWTGYGNDDVRSVHGGDRHWGILTRRGACYAGQRVRVCAWRT